MEMKLQRQMTQVQDFGRGPTSRPARPVFFGEQEPGDKKPEALNASDTLKLTGSPTPELLKEGPPPPAKPDKKSRFSKAIIFWGLLGLGLGGYATTYTIRQQQEQTAQVQLFDTLMAQMEEPDPNTQCTAIGEVPKLKHDLHKVNVLLLGVSSEDATTRQLAWKAIDSVNNQEIRANLLLLAQAYPENPQSKKGMDHFLEEWDDFSRFLNAYIHSHRE